MKKNKKLVAIIVVAIAALGTLLWVMFGGETGLVTDTPSGRVINFSGADLREEQDGKLIWALTADTIEYDPQTKAINMKNLKGTFNQDDVVMQLTAPEAVMSSDHKQLDMTGGIHATTSEGVVFDTDALHFDNTKKELSTQVPFTFSGKDVVITGDSVTANMALQKVLVKGNAKLVKQ
ncbi:MAG: LPS export ABC transporter periplasmic protein LptC [Veillonella sp.]|nr:LPS export ABC transporter periplasmic protein LptC [Veillonella sp.]MCF0155920.1 LPS export ABC transporter periplasmic protein LptC [Veillonella sp.]